MRSPAAAVLPPSPEANKAGAEYARALEAARAGRPDEAEPILKDVITKFPDLANAHYNLAYVYQLKKDWKGAEASYQRVTELEPAKSDAYLALSAVRQLDGRSVIGGVTPVQLALRGNLDDAIDGTMRVADTDVPALVAVLDATGLVDVQRDVITAGAIAGEVRIAGDLRDPTIEGRAVLRNAVIAQIAAGSIRADISGRPLQRQLEFDLEAGVRRRHLEDRHAVDHVAVARAPPLDRVVPVDPAGPPVIRLEPAQDIVGQSK